MNVGIEHKKRGALLRSIPRRILMTRPDEFILIFGWGHEFEPDVSDERQSFDGRCKRRFIALGRVIPIRLKTDTCPIAATD
jgi:hypothetical protein